MNKLQSIKGMKDLLPVDTAVWQRIEDAVRRVLERYGYAEIRLPIVERTELFARSIGEQTDIVGKEMYTFPDLDGESITLRPEGTAGCVRAGIQHGLFHNRHQRLYYWGPMFRHERPQRGRLRQFHQLGVEAVGWAGPDIDAELIQIGTRIWREVGASGLALHINSLGDVESRLQYRQRLVEYFSKYRTQLDNDSQRRIDTNPLRILDSKDNTTQQIASDAPEILDYLDAESKSHFEELCEYLDAAGIAYTIDQRLVRGLDYYSRTVFEWISGDLGAQGTVCAGGRYDRLVEQLGGRATPAAGFALGLERLLDLLGRRPVQTDSADVYMISLGDPARKAGLVLADTLRDAGLTVISYCGTGGLKNQMKHADKSGATVAVLLGEDELKSDMITVKPLRSGQRQLTAPADRLLEIVRGCLDASATQTANSREGIYANG